MPNFRLSRRAVLRGAGSIAIALPWLEIMLPERRAQADVVAGSSAKHFLAVFQPGGTVRKDASGVDKWAPTGSELDFALSPIMKPLEPMRKKLLIVDGPDMTSAVGEQHQAGIIAWLTGSKQAVASDGTLQYATGPSIDQVIAQKIYANQKKKSIQLAIRWATGKSHGSLHPINCANFDADNHSPIGPLVDPQATWKSLFGSLVVGGAVDAKAAAALKRKQSILDFVDKGYDKLSQRLGAGDKQRLQEHLSKIRELENGLMALPSTAAACAQVPSVDTSDYNPHPAYSDDGSLKDTATDTAIPKVGKFMMDMMVMALACDMTPVGTLQWSDTEAKHTFPWLSLPSNQHHHFYQHDGGFQPVQCEQICTWYSQQHLYLLQQLDAVKITDHSLLDETVVFFGSELQDPPTHKKNNMGFLLAGGGGLNTGTNGRWLKKPGESHNNLLVSLLNLFGDARTSFGSEGFSTGPMSGIV